MENRRINVAVAFDDKYSRYAYTTALSLFENNSDYEVYLYVLQCDLTDATRQEFEKLAMAYRDHIVFLDVDINRFEDKLPKQNKWPVQVYFRLLLTELLPKEVDRLLYLDSDMIICKSLWDMFSMDMEGNDIAGCYDLSLITANLDIFLYYRHDKFADMFNEKSYINSGMLLMDIEKMRKNYNLSTYLEAAAELDYKIYAPDQDLINYVHRGKILQLNPREYNYPGYMTFYEIGDNERIKSEVPIIHFICEKPWQGGNHAHYASEMIWWEYAYKTPYKQELMDNYLEESILDPTMIQNLEGTDSVKQKLLEENARLKAELNNAMDQVKRVISMFEKR